MDIKRYFRNGSGREIFPIGEDVEESHGQRGDANRQTIGMQNGYSRTISSRIHKMGCEDTYIKVIDKKGEVKNNQGVVTKSRIRRLTPTECERLQGFHDGWTKYGNYDGEVKEVSDTQRYKCLGNAVSVPVVKAIGERLLKH